MKKYFSVLCCAVFAFAIMGQSFNPAYPVLDPLNGIQLQRKHIRCPQIIDSTRMNVWTKSLPSDSVNNPFVSSAKTLRAVVIREVEGNEKFGFVNEHGKEVIPLIYDEATNFYNGHACVRKGSNHYLIDRDGNVIMELTTYISRDKNDRFMYYGSFNPINGRVQIRVSNDDSGDENGDDFLTWDSLGTVKKIHLIRSVSTGKDLRPSSNGFSRITSFKKRSAAKLDTMYNVKYGFVDLSGNRMPNCSYDYAMDFSDSLANVHRDGKSGYIDVTGKVVIPFSFDGEKPRTVCKFDKEHWNDDFWQSDEKYEIGQFKDGLAIQRLNGECVIIDKSGNIINRLNEFKGYTMPLQYFNNGIIVFFAAPTIADDKVIDSVDEMGCSAYDINGYYIVPRKTYSFIGPFIEVKSLKAMPL